MTAGNLDDQAVIGAKFELVPAEHPRLRHPVKPRLHERLMHLNRVGTTFVRFILLFPQQAAQRDRTLEQPLRRHVRFGSQDSIGSSGGGYIQFHVHAPSKKIAALRLPNRASPGRSSGVLSTLWRIAGPLILASCNPIPTSNRGIIMKPTGDHHASRRQNSPDHGR
jgi:hypothetical protein